MKKRIMCLLIIFLIILCLIIGYFIYISYYNIDITGYEISSDKINEEINIVMIGDVHDHHCRIKDEIIEEIKEIGPDIILCVGDIIDNQSKDDKSTIAFLSSLKKIADVYMSLGNHELEYSDTDNFVSHLKENGINVLDKEYQDIEVNGNKIRIGGIYDYAFSSDDGSIDKESMNNNAAYRFLNDMQDTDSFTLMMSHRPDSFIFGKAYKWDFDLVVCGHYHGGQVILPFIGGLYVPELEWFPKIDYGKYLLGGQMEMIVTRGISSSGELLPRFNNPPEIVNIILKGE